MKDADELSKARGPAALLAAVEAARPASTAVDKCEPIAPDPAAEWAGALAASVISSADLAALDIPARPKLLGDWFAEGDLGYVFAPRGVGKTWFSLHMSRAIAEGGTMGEWDAPAPAAVLYVDGEMPADLMRERDRGMTASDAELYFLNHALLFERSSKTLNIASPVLQAAIATYCEAHAIKVLVLDNLSTLAAGVGENDADEWEKLKFWLLGLRRAGTAVIIVHHAGRNGQMRGTSKREDDAFWVISLSDFKGASVDPRGARFISTFTKRSRNTQESIPSYEWRYQTDEATGQVLRAHKLADSLAVFRQLIEDGVTSCAELAEEMSVTKGTVSKLAKRAMREGWLKKQGRDYVMKDSRDGNEGGEK